MHQAIVFHVPDDRFDGIASFELTPDAARHSALLACLLSGISDKFACAFGTSRYSAWQPSIEFPNRQPPTWHVISLFAA